MKMIISIVLSIFSLSAFAQEQFAGKWSSNVNTIRFYSDDGTINYTSCRTDLVIDVKDHSATQKKLSVTKLKAVCSHPSFWDFNQFLPEAEFIIDSSTGIAKHNSEKVGTVTNSVMEIKYDIGGQLFFLDAKFNSDGTLHFEWSSRSYETVNFDVINNLEKN